MKEIGTAAWSWFFFLIHKEGGTPPPKGSVLTTEDGDRLTTEDGVLITTEHE